MAKPDTSKGPDPRSIRSKKRVSRGFKNLETSTRKGRRAKKRQLIARTIGREVHEPGTKAWTSGTGQKGWLHTAGGSNHYHKV